MLSDFFNLPIILSPFLLDDTFFNPTLFISSIVLQCGNPILLPETFCYFSFLFLYPYLQ